MLNSIAVPSHRLRLTVLAGVLAMCLGLSGAAFVAGASAEPSGGSGSGSSGQSCTLGDGSQMDDGEVTTYRTGNRHGSVTCSNGTICREDGTKNADGSTTWTSACKDANGTVWLVHAPGSSIVALPVAQLAPRR
jgi:hypothetical protein